MSEINKVQSSGTLQLINGKKYRGHLEADENGAAFYTKGNPEPVAQWHYARMNRMDNIRRGGTTSQITVILKDDTRYVLELAQGLKLYSHMDKNWTDKPVTPRTRGDELRRLAELRGEKIQTPKKHLITRRHPNRSIGGDIGIYLLLIIFAVAMVFPVVFLIGSALKPLNELFRFPPPIWPQNPTLDNFSDLFVTMGRALFRSAGTWSTRCSSPPSVPSATWSSPAWRLLSWPSMNSPAGKLSLPSLRPA